MQERRRNYQERRRDHGPGLGFLLLIPAAVIIAKAASRRRAMWDVAGGGPRGHYRGFGQPAGGEFRLPPKIEWMLESWHTRAHEKDQRTGPADSTTV